MAMNQIRGHNIYIGGILSLKNQAALSRANITHIVSVLRLNQADELLAPFQRHVIEVDDVSDEDLLVHLPAAVRFIQSGLDAGGSVLVHCNAGSSAMGKSRSATVCIAYLLSRQPAVLTPQSALEILRESRPLCEPNEGFMEQLALYHKMGCPEEDITDNNHLYSRWLYHREVQDSVACGRAPDMQAVLFEDDSKASQASGANNTEIKCRKCRRTLATTSFVIPHEQKSKPSSTTECAHVFLHPLTWMKPSLFPGSSSSTSSSPSVYGSHPADAPLSGRLTCPGCSANIGKFAWQGMQCSCGHWVVPAIGVAKARVDVVTRVNLREGNTNNTGLPPASLGIRLPPGMRSHAPESGRGSL
ncbi:hypothetical protein ASPZODRAFT_70960 [Penicilliopsis zonata CBS 506.65]|uniref:protein-tyrosine-phosphatase n=1 Tax=Penicilliopsis zonata CBS 506.65 TaxID=1073090 RepID=A0A1L9SC71_9EURO|nr:hypothetical protein ASPZODRAFT_70960 [Penicilliopsis zonata CBS 506.65]OJJ44728.1 hypothetical protein ASPZODRAFT_70960 [Penicilliopsis zonata CBS 506.65]